MMDNPPICESCAEWIWDDMCYVLDDMGTCVCERCIKKAVKAVSDVVLREFVQDRFDECLQKTPFKNYDPEAYIPDPD